jgi:hypothetical protein
LCIMASHLPKIPSTKSVQISYHSHVIVEVLSNCSGAKQKPKFLLPEAKPSIYQLPVARGRARLLEDFGSRSSPAFS